ncbi:hypothetical protein KEM54_001824 [Ascosphaera aggregata]|nr:hypothetical protein KEM54_001824 [Ascosphaera aggregata]
MSGYVEKVGQGVVGFKPGDRVAAMHQMCQPHGAWAEYAIAWSSTTFHIPDNISFEEAATIPLNGLTAAVSLFFNLRLPTPMVPANRQTPLIVSGAGTSVGTFLIKLAIESNIHPVIAIAGTGCQYINTLLDHSKGDEVVDYRQDPAKVLTDVKTAILRSGTSHAKYAFEAIGSQSNVDMLKEVLDSDGHVDYVLPPSVNVGPLTHSTTFVQYVHAPVKGVVARTLGYMISNWFTLGLQTGKFTGHPYVVKKGGLDAIGTALSDMKAHKNKGVKYIVRVGETDGITI